MNRGEHTHILSVRGFFVVVVIFCHTNVLFCFPILYFLVSGEFFSTAVIQMFAVSFIYLTLFYVRNLLAARHSQMVIYIYLIVFLSFPYTHRQSQHFQLDS